MTFNVEKNETTKNNIHNNKTGVCLSLHGTDIHCLFFKVFFFSSERIRAIFTFSRKRQK